MANSKSVKKLLLEPSRSGIERLLKNLAITNYPLRMKMTTSKEVTAARREMDALEAALHRSPRWKAASARYRKADAAKEREWNKFLEEARAIRNLYFLKGYTPEIQKRLIALCKQVGWI